MPAEASASTTADRGQSALMGGPRV